jgi:hypothetical protein
MTFTGLDTHETVKDLKAAGFTDEQAEALTRALRRSQEIDLSNLATKADLAQLQAATKADLAQLQAATKADLAQLRTEIAELRAELIKWVVGVGFAQVAMILAVLRLFPGGHP